MEVWAGAQWVAVQVLADEWGRWYFLDVDGACVSVQVGMRARLASSCQDVDQNRAPLAGLGNERSGSSLRSPSDKGDQRMAASTTLCQGSMLPPLTYAEVEHPPGMPPPHFFSTASESSLPGEKRTQSFAGTLIGLRSRGLTPLRAALLRTLNKPKPTKRTS